MKQIFLLLIILPLLSFGQSKKDLKARIYSMQVDSANLSELVRDLQNVNAAAEQTIGNQLAVLQEAQQEIAEMYDRISVLTKDINEAQQELQDKGAIITSLKDQVNSLTTEKELLEEELARVLEDVSGIGYAQGDEFTEPFDFGYYEGWNYGHGINPSTVYPIGWSDNGVVAYREDYCDGACGCCGTAIIIRDIKSNVTLGYQFNPRGDAYDHTNGSGSSLWDDEDYKNSTRELLAAYQILPTKFGRYSTSSYIPSCRGDIEVIVEKNGEHYYVKTRNNGDLQLVYQGDLEEDHLYFDWLSNVDYAGFFLDESNQFATIVLIHRKHGFEAELDFKIELVGIELP
ncbi:MAG: hypothetical protein CMN34_03465 [Saprospirales bacterium]|nr:hypothetical protein [Saprospirales bacterium]